MKSKTVQIKVIRIHTTGFFEDNVFQFSSGSGPIHEVQKVVRILIL
jgi:hypothetical protein